MRSQMSVIAGSKVERATQGGECQYRHFFADVAPEFVMAQLVGACDIAGVRLVGIGQGFMQFKVVQGGVQQRHAPRCRTAVPKADHWQVGRDVKVDVDMVDVKVQAMALLDQPLEQRFGKGAHIEDVLKLLVHSVVRGPALGQCVFECAVLSGGDGCKGTVQGRFDCFQTLQVGRFQVRRPARQ